jgi:enoyl-CoA hydratase/carnithine racemase
MSALLQVRLPGPVVQEALLTGRRYSAPEALAGGLVHEIAPENEVLERALALAGSLADKDSATVGALKQGLFAPALAALEAALPDWITRDVMGS